MKLAEEKIYIMLLIRKRFLEKELRKRPACRKDPLENEMKEIELSLQVIERIAEPPKFVYAGSKEDIPGIERV